MKFLVLAISILFNTNLFTMTAVELLPGDLDCLFSQQSSSPFSPQGNQFSTANEETDVSEFDLSGLFSQTSNPLASPLKTSQDLILLSQASNTSATWGIESSDDSSSELTEDIFGDENDVTANSSLETKTKKRKANTVKIPAEPSRKSARVRKQKAFYE